MKKMIKIAILFIVLSGFFAQDAFTQENTVRKTDLESILGRFSNYRYGTVSIWKFKNDDRDKIREAIKEFNMAESGETAVSSELLKSVDERIINAIRNCVLGGTSPETCFDDTEMSLPGVKMPSWADYQAIYESIRKEMTGGGGKQIKTVYLVTTRGNQDFRGSIIALIVSYDDEGIVRNLEGPVNQDIYVVEEMKLVTLTDINEPSAANIYDLAERRLAQGNLENKTIEAQGIGYRGQFGQRTWGNVESLFKNESDITSEDIQKVKAISDIQPTKLYIKENELLISPDLVSWRYYEVPMYENDNGEMIVDSFYAVNDRLPKLGLELKYGIDEINFPSLWSERMTFSALWQNVKMGVILPTSGWASLTKDAFSIDRTLTYAGFGIAGEMDFPIKIIPKSGIFHLGFGYVFGDAKEPSYKNRDLDPEVYVTDQNINDYLVRLNAQLHYTFAMQIDNDYLFRFGIGGTIYTVERWYNQSVEDEFNEKSIVYKKLKSETIGGLSGKVEFMSKNVTTPYGGSVQYFDEGLGLNVWLQIPIVENTFALRLDAKGYFKAFADNPRDWENESVFIPMARFIINF